MKKDYKNCLKKVHFWLSITIFFILAHEISSVRSIIKQIVSWPQHMFHTYDYTSVLASWHYYMDWFGFGTLVILLIIKVVLHSKLKRKTKKSMRAKGDNAFESCLLRYLNQENQGQSFLLSGSWGVGKTYMLDEFMKKYYDDSSRNVYKISCFGLTSRKDVIDELNKIIAGADNSFTAKIVELISKIPVFGDFLEGLLKKSYGYSNVDKNSIFIFEDFERIASYQTVRAQNAASGKRLRDPDYYSSQVISESVANEIRNSAFEVLGIAETIRFQAEKEDSDKYLAIVGVINDIVDHLKCKAIIVCNTNMIGEKFTSDVLRSKLNCHEFRKNATEEIRKQLAVRVLDSITIEDKDKADIIKSYLNVTDYSLILKILGNENLRQFSNVIEAFIVTAELFDKDTLNKPDFKKSLFASILVVLANIGTRGLDDLKKMPTGISIHLLPNTNRFGFCGLNWIGFRVSAYFFLNLERPANVEKIVERWDEYIKKYHNIEACMISKNISAFDQYSFNTIHLCKLLEFLSESEEDFVDWRKYLRALIYSNDEILHTTQTGITEESSKESYDKLKNRMIDENVNAMFGEMSDHLKIRNRNLDDAIFEVVAKETGNTKCTGGSQYAHMYNEYLDEHGLEKESA